MTKTLLAQQVLFCLRKELKTPSHIVEEMRADESYVDDHLAKMTEAEVLEESDGKHRANGILSDKEDVETLKKEFDKRSQAIAGVVANHVTSLSRCIQRINPTEQGFEEEYLR